MIETSGNSTRSPYKDPVTARRHRIMMRARVLLILPFIGLVWWHWPVWIPVAAFVGWYAIWFLWAAGGLEH